MHILVITDEIFPDAIGGIAKAVHSLSAAWVRAGHQAQVLVRGPNPGAPSTDIIDNVPIVRFLAPRRKSPFYYLYPISIVFQVWRWLRKQSQTPDIVHIHNPIYMIAVALSGISTRSTIVLHYYAPIASELEISARRGKYLRWGFVFRLAALAFNRVERWAIRRADHVILTSQFMRAELERLHPGCLADDRSTIAPLGVDLSRYRVIPQREARQQIGLKPDQPILISARRLVGRMGLPALIEAMIRIRADYSRCLLLIAGEGYLRPQLEQQIRDFDLGDNARLLGFVAEADLPYYLASADLYVLPTEQLEGFGLGTIEALAVGVPVIGTPIGATPEILAEVDPRLIARDNSVEAIAETALFWLANPGEREAAGLKARSVVERMYNIDHVAGQLVALFEKIIARKRAGVSANAPTPSSK